jgi:outer membrane protein assembly factor BamE (lipoprotein component of BamABCDE complex)
MIDTYSNDFGRKLWLYLFLTQNKKVSNKESKKKIQHIIYQINTIQNKQTNIYLSLLT